MQRHKGAKTHTHLRTRISQLPVITAWIAILVVIDNCTRQCLWACPCLWPIRRPAGAGPRRSTWSPKYFYGRKRRLPGLRVEILVRGRLPSRNPPRHRPLRRKIPQLPHLQSHLSRSHPARRVAVTQVCIGNGASITSIDSPSQSWQNIPMNIQP